VIEDWNWPEYKDPDEWNDVAVVRVWQDVLGDRLIGIPSKMRMLYNDVLKRFYYGPIAAQLNDTTPLLRRLEGTGSPMPSYMPPWYKLRWRRLKRRVWDVRVKVGFWIAAHHPDYNDDD
jgi:hypothetical protein